MKKLTIHLCGPLQSYSYGDCDRIKRTRQEPTHSAITGMIAACGGIKRKDPKLDEISNSFKIIKKKMPHIKLIQSFADGRLGCGTIYKASNFKYYGCSTATFYDDLTTGEIAKDTLLNDTRSLKTMIEENEKLLDGQLKFFKVKSYRYIYSLRKGAFKGIKFKEKEYPTYQKGKEYFERPIKINEIIRCYIGCFIYNKNDVVYKFENLLKENKIDIDEIFNILETNKTILKLINKENNSIENLKKIILNRYKINN